MMFKDIFSMVCRHAAVCASVVVALTAVGLTGCEKAASEKNPIDVAREDFYSSMGVKEGEGSVKFLEARSDTAYAPYEVAQMFELVAQAGELTAELRGVEPAFVADSLTMERLSKKTANMGDKEMDDFLKRQQAYAVQKGRVDSLRTMFDECTTEIARIIGEERGFCGYKVTATVNDEAGREEKLVFLTDKAATKVLLKMREADYEEMQRIIKERMSSK